MDGTDREDPEQPDARFARTCPGCGCKSDQVRDGGTCPVCGCRKAEYGRPWEVPMRREP
jgi:hypothetical protein